MLNFNSYVHKSPATYWQIKPRTYLVVLHYVISMANIPIPLKDLNLNSTAPSFGIQKHWSRDPSSIKQNSINLILTGKIAFVPENLTSFLIALKGIFQKYLPPI